MRHTLRHFFALVLIVLPACGSSESGSEREQATSSISLVATPNSATIRVGATATFVVRMARGDGTLDPVPEARWSSGNEGIATIDPVTGIAKGVAPGRAQLSASYGPGTASASIEVTP